MIDLPYEPVELYSSVDFLENIIAEGRTRRLPNRGTSDYIKFHDAVEQARLCYEAMYRLRDDLDLKDLRSLDGVMREMTANRGIDAAVMGFGPMTILDETWAVMQEAAQYDIQEGEDFRDVYDAARRVIKSYQNAAQFYMDMKLERAEQKEEATNKIRMTPPRPLPAVAKGQ